MAYKISLLDQSPIAPDSQPYQALAHTVELARLAEAAGYHRFWVSEHHGSDKLAGSSPEVLIAWLLAHTRTLRIGSGGIMLQHYSPYKVAENFQLLAALAPGRVDLGVGKAPGGLPLSTLALQQEQNPDSRLGFDEKLRQLTGFLDASRNEDPRFTSLVAAPQPPQAAEKFLLGASPESARLAASLGWNFVFAGFINSDRQVLAESILTYQQVKSPENRTLLALSAVAADSREQASALVREQYNYKVYIGDNKPLTVGSQQQAEEFIKQAGAAHSRIDKQPLNILHGTADYIHQILGEYNQQFEIDEFILHTPINETLSRQRSVQLIGKHHRAEKNRQRAGSETPQV